MKRVFSYTITEKDAGKTVEKFLLEHEYTPTCIKWLVLKVYNKIINLQKQWAYED